MNVLMRLNPVGADKIFDRIVMRPIDESTQYEIMDRSVILPPKQGSIDQEEHHFGSMPGLRRSYYSVNTTRLSGMSVFHSSTAYKIQSAHQEA